ncbi:MAG TPA: toprim domain-containing protein [Paracoccus solventivorans]|uniref:toprim domain-containing protein n=1 Tax=Paracoccaceae TaxID=31989 RepID=UPI002B67C558|nr:toprim domain-containing protein [Paracoccus solventivorans]HMM08772.1 toprim domain-containing protein [Paracoccus solventivorans]
MSARDWQAFDAELSARVPELVVELLGKPTLRTGHEWRWGRKGSLSVVIGGAKAGMWFDHEAGGGGGFIDLVGRNLGLSRGDALDWTADRIGMGRRHRPARTRPAPPILSTNTPTLSQAQPGTETSPQPHLDDLDPAVARAEEAAARAARIWANACPAPDGHSYLAAKQVAALGLRMDARGQLVVPLQDIDGRIHSLETIAPDGAKRYLAGGAKRGHFTVVGAEPGPLPEPTGPVLICEGWATGASLHIATGHAVIAAMDAGNLMPVAEALRARFPAADLVLVADNDAKPDRDGNPGVEAARKVALAVDGRLAVPGVPGDANDLFCAKGPESVAALVAVAARIPPPPPTYPAPVLTPDEARASLAEAIASFMAAIPDYWAAVEAAREAAKDSDATRDPLDFNIVARAALPPLLGLPVDVGLGKTSSARTAIAELIAAGALGKRKVVYAVPRHDLGAEQVAAFEALGVSAMLWKGRTAPDPTDDKPDRLMCLDTEATFDALEIEHPVEQSCCKVKNGAELLLCPLFHDCGYQRQKPLAQAAQVIVCAHDSLFHMKPEAIGEVGLLVIDEAFWQSGLRGLDGKATLTQDGLEPGRTSLTCYNGKGKMDVGATADLVAARERLCKALRVTEPGPLRLGLLEAVGLTPDDCRHTATLERRRMRDAGLRPGMSPVERRKRIEAILPQAGEPWAPPGRCATLWLILAEALENGHDAAGAELVHEMTGAGSVRALRLRWRSTMRKGWAAQAAILHLDATLRPELVQTYLPRIDIGTPVAARQPHVRVRQVTGSPTSARALTPSPDAPERDRKAAATRLRDLRAWIDLRARQCHRPGRAINLLVVGQKVAIDALRSAGLPPRVEAVHFNALSGLDRWGGIGGMVVFGRTLPAPRTVELIAMALTGRVPAPNPDDAGWWYPMTERRLRLADDRTAPLAMEEHADPIAEAVRWSICEGELIQAMGRGRGVNRTAATPLEIDLLTDVVLPVAVDALVPWSDLRPTRRDLMALTGIVLENAADMAACFPELWPTREAAKKDGQRKGTNDYYGDLYNSRLSPSSAEVTYRPQGAGHRSRAAHVDLSRILDPEAWLTNRLGPLASFEMRSIASNPAGDDAAARIDALASRLTVSMQAVLAARRAALDALSVRLEATKPAELRRPDQPHPEEETEA